VRKGPPLVDILFGALWLALSAELSAAGLDEGERGEEKEKGFSGGEKEKKK